MPDAPGLRLALEMLAIAASLTTPLVDLTSGSWNHVSWLKLVDGLREPD